MIGSLVVLPFPLDAVKKIETETTLQQEYTADAPPPPRPSSVSVTQPLQPVPESFTAESPPSVEPPSVVYILPALPRTDDLCQQELQIVTIGTVVVAAVLCSILLNALIRA